MSNVPPPPPSSQPPRGSGNPFSRFTGSKKSTSTGSDKSDKPPVPRWSLWVVLGVVAILAFGSRLTSSSSGTKVTYTEFLVLVDKGDVKRVSINNTSNVISGTLTNGTKFATTGAMSLSDADEQLLKARGVD
ncbi:MAG: ATP-dependent metallopeptidase FtsH/Yme1/Tma family protein, partial [Ilumatobacteraceae bacterium]|nr:ATP-dependent metallopeptidase FtsH/Yme1/Tma family protein [Ilumatobacteraceae bacterium]